MIHLGEKKRQQRRSELSMNRVTTTTNFTMSMSVGKIATEIPLREVQDIVYIDVHTNIGEN